MLKYLEKLFIMIIVFLSCVLVSMVWSLVLLFKVDWEVNELLCILRLVESDRFK